MPAPVESLDTELEIRDLDLEALLKRDFDPSELEARDAMTAEELDARDAISAFELEDRDIEKRASRTLQGLATFDTISANTNINKELGVYGGLNWQGFGM